MLAFVLLAGTGATASASVSISSKPTRHMVCSLGICTPTAAQANLNVEHLSKLLARSNVRVVADSRAIDMKVINSVMWTSDSQLTLDSYSSIVIDAPVTIVGEGGLTLTTNDGGTAGDFSFSKKGRIEFRNTSSALVINRNNYTLANSIAMLAELISMNDLGYYALAGNYDAKPDGIYTSTPIQQLNGVFEGLGNRISNLKVRDSASGEVGLIGTLWGATIRDVELESATVTGTTTSGFSHDVGTLVGYSDEGSIINTSATGKTTGGGGYVYVGGLVGHDRGTVTNCRAGVLVKIVGQNGGFAGGLAGTLDSGTVTSLSSATGAVNAGKYGSAGGLGGWNLGIISQSYAMGNVSGRSDQQLAIGGLVAQNSGGLLENSYSTGIVSADQEMTGGMVGDNSPYSGTNGTIAASYSIGLVQGGATGLTGGLIGNDLSPPNSISDSYWDLDTSGISNPSQGAGSPANDPGITGLTDAQLRSGLPAGFDPGIWGQSPSINNGYPYLLANPPQ